MICVIIHNLFIIYCYISKFAKTAIYHFTLPLLFIIKLIFYSLKNEFFSSITNKLCIKIFICSMKSLCRSVPPSQHIDCNTFKILCNILWKIPGQLYCILILHAFFRSGSNDFYFILYFHPKVVITQSRFTGMKFQPVQRGQIPSYEYKGKSDFIPVRRDSFPPGNFLDLYAFSICIWKHLLINLFISLRRDKAISSR